MPSGKGTYGKTRGRPKKKKGGIGTSIGGGIGSFASALLSPKKLMANLAKFAKMAKNKLEKLKNLDVLKLIKGEIEDIILNKEDVLTIVSKNDLINEL